MRRIGATRTAWLSLGYLALNAGACSHGRPAVRTGPAPEPARASAVQAAIAAAEEHLRAGLVEGHAGRLRPAREEFDRAVDVYLAFPGGVHADARLAQAYRRTIEQIHVRELELLLGADPLSEAPSEPAAIDEVAGLAVEQAAPSEDARRLAEEVLRSNKSDFPLELNEAVLACIDLYRGPLREWYGAALARGAPLLPFIRQLFAAEGLPQDLAYVALVESAYKPAALSRAQARGVWQFMPTTGRRFGLRQDWWIDERSDPAKATRAAARYLKELQRLLGDWNLALAAYNLGERRVLRATARHGTTDFWQLSQAAAFPRETRNYIPMIHAAIIVAQAPAKHGIALPPQETLPFEFVPVRDAVDLRTLAECARCPLEQLQALNPELKRLSTPMRRSFDVRVPRGTGLAALACLSSLPPEKRVTLRTHVVARGQTLGSIARRHGVRVSEIAEANDLRPNHPLRPGTQLIVPAPGVTPRTRRTAPASPSATTHRHRVRPHETLTSIAALHGTSVEALRRLNGLRSTQIAVGAELLVPRKR